MVSVFDSQLQQCAAALSAGGVVIYPTDTIFGLGCLPTSADAIEKIRMLKQRVEQKPFVLLVAGKQMLQEYVADIPAAALAAIDSSTSPLTIVYPKAKNLPPTLLAEDGSVALRICGFNFCVQLMQLVQSPLLSTSVNITAQAPITDLHHLPQYMREKVDYIVEGIPSKGNQPSKILKITQDGRTHWLRF